MSLIVEDGTGVEGAETYISADDARAYALKRGVSLPAIVNEIDPVEALLVKAMDYLSGKRWIGEQGVGVLAWPRVASCGNGFGPVNPLLNGATIPQALKNAQAQLVIEQNNGVDLAPTTQAIAQGGGVVIEKTIGPITKKYSDKVGLTSGAIMPAVDTLLSSLLATSTRLQLRTVRV